MLEQHISREHGTIPLLDLRLVVHLLAVQPHFGGQRFPGVDVKKEPAEDALHRRWLTVAERFDDSAGSES